MHLDSNQLQFFQKRRKLSRLWPAAGSVLIVMLLGFSLWLYLRAPMLIDPFEAMNRVRAGTIEESTLIVAAVLLPVMMLTCIVVLIVMIVFAFAAFSTEKKYLDLVEELLKQLRNS